MSKLYCVLCAETAEIDGNDVTLWDEAQVVYNGHSVCVRHFFIMAPKKEKKTV